MLFISNAAFAEEGSEDADDAETESDGEIVVTGTRTEILAEDSTVSVEVISAEKLRDFGPGDLTDALQQLAGVNIQRGVLGSSPTLQGFDPKHTLVLVNGQRLLGSKNGIIDLSRISITNIERIEIIRGAASVLYGSDAMGGVINIITKEAQDPFLVESTYQHGTYGMIQADGRIGFQREDFGYVLSANFRTGDGYDLDTTTESTDGSDFRQLELGYQNHVFVNDAMRLESRASYIARDSKRVSSNGKAVYDQAKRFEEAMLQVTPSWKPSETSNLSATINASAYRDQFLQDQRHAVSLDSFQQTDQRLGALVIQHDHFLGGHLLTEGVEAQFEFIETERLVDERANRERMALYIQDQWNDIGGRDVHLLSGIRLDMDSWFGFYPTPNVALRFDPLPAFRVRMVYGMGYRAPSFKELFLFFENPSAGYVVEGNPSLKPETSQSFQAEFEVFLPFFNFNANFFRNNIENLIMVASATSSTEEQLRWTYENNAQAYTQGIELRLNAPVLPILSINGNYNLIDTKDIEQDRPLEGRARHNASAGLRLVFDTGTMLQGNASFVGPRSFYFDVDGDGQEDSVQSDPYSMLNVRIAQKIGDQFELFIGANNILDAGESDFLNIQPRWFHAGLGGRISAGEAQ
ncbi:MAG: TonB-dependent receptor [Myxococcota bacterium]|nr:TonB-dependent receptor [Myxococcota bacterium]